MSADNTNTKLQGCSVTNDNDENDGHTPMDKERDKEKIKDMAENVTSNDKEDKNLELVGGERENENANDVVQEDVVENDKEMKRKIDDEGENAENDNKQEQDEVDKAEKSTTVCDDKGRSVKTEDKVDVNDKNENDKNDNNQERGLMDKLKDKKTEIQNVNSNHNEHIPYARQENDDHSVLHQDLDIEKPNDEARKEIGKIGLLKKRQIKNVLRNLYSQKVLSDEEYQQCISKERKMAICEEMVDIVLKKDGGEFFLKKALLGVGGEDSSSDEELKLSDTIKEQERQIAHLKTERDRLHEENERKAEEIQYLKNQRPMNVVEPLQRTTERTMISTIEERRRASHGLIVPLVRETSEPLTKDNEIKQLQEEVRALKHHILTMETEIQSVQQLRAMFPYLKNVFDCPSYQIEIRDQDLPSPLFCPLMKFSATSANPTFCDLHNDTNLANSPSSHNNTKSFKKYHGTSGTTPFILQATLSNLLPPPIHYWEANAVVSLECMVLSFHTLFEVGLCEEHFVDKMSWLYKSPRSWSLRICVCRDHRWGICVQVYGSAAKQGLCYPHAMSNISQTSATLCFGVVLDIGKGMIAFIDVGKERVLHTFHVHFKNNVYPMFAVEPLADVCAINMKLLSGENIDMTDKKKRLIEKALSDRF